MCSGGGDSTSHSSVSSMRGTTTVGVPSAADSITSDGSGGTISKPGLRAFTHRVSYACARAHALSTRQAGTGGARRKGGAGLGGRRDKERQRRRHLKPDVSRASAKATGVALKDSGAAARRRSAPGQGGCMDESACAACVPRRPAKGAQAGCDGAPCRTDLARTASISQMYMRQVTCFTTCP